MHIVLSIIGWVLLSLLVLLIVVLIVPVGIILQYKESVFNVDLQILFLKFKLFPTKEEEEKQPQPEKQPDAEEKPQGKKTKAKKKLNFTIDEIVKIISTCGGAIRLLLRGIWFKKISLVLPIHKDNASDTAIEYGKMQGYVGGLIAFLQNYLNLQFKQVNIIADFQNEFEQNLYFYCKIVSAPIIIVIVAIYALVRLKKDDII